MIEIVSSTPIRSRCKAGGIHSGQNFQVIIPGVLIATIKVILGHGEIITRHLFQEGIVVAGNIGFEYITVIDDTLHRVFFPYVS